MEEIKSYISKKITFIVILCALIIGVLLMGLYIKSQYFNSDSNKVNDLRKNILILKEGIEKINKENEIIDKKIDSLKTNVDTIHKKININNKKLENLDKYEKDKKNSFRSYDADMWERYFTDRYSTKK